MGGLFSQSDSSGEESPYKSGLPRTLGVVSGNQMW